MSVKLNSDALTAMLNHSMFQSQRRLKTALERLSSGKRINSAADDPAGLAIAAKFRANIKSYAAARRNINDGISMTQTADGALSEVSNILTRIRELAVQAADGTLTDTNRSSINTEMTSLRTEIENIAQKTEFNDKVLLNGSISSYDIQTGIGSSSNDRISIAISSSSVTAIGSSGSSTLNNISLASQSNAQNALDVIDAAIDDVSSIRASVGTYQNRLSYAYNAAASAEENLIASKARIEDVDVAAESAQVTAQQIKIKAASSLLAQVKYLPSIALELIK